MVILAHPSNLAPSPERKPRKFSLIAALRCPQTLYHHQVLVRWWRLEAFMKATNLLHRAMRAVSYCRITTAIEMASKGGGMLLIVVLIVFLAAAGAIRSK
jgi:hypothetical protein